MFEYPPVPSDVVNAIRGCTTAVVVGHIGPDGDCIHSQIAAQKLFQRLGATVHLLNAGPFNRKEIRSYEQLFAPHLDAQVRALAPLVVMVDCSTVDRIGYLADEIQGLPLLTIDHHASGSRSGDLCYIVPKSFSTTLCIMQLYKALEVEITQEIAEHLFFGLATDTGYMKFIGPYRGETFRLMGELNELGVSPNEIYNEMEGGNTLASRQFLGAMLSRIEQRLDGRLLMCTESESDLVQFGKENRPSDSLYAHLLSIEGVEAVLYFKIVSHGVWEIGLRASHQSVLDVGAISASLGGGGHRKAAGVTITGTQEELAQRITQIMASQLD